MLSFLCITACANTDGLPYVKRINIDLEENSDNGLLVQFLGNTSIYIQDLTTNKKQSIFIDAFVSRPSLLHLVFGKVSHSDLGEINRQLKAASIETIDIVLPLHSHFDHLLDAPAIAHEKGAKMISTETTRYISSSMGYSDDERHELVFKADSKKFKEVVLDNKVFKVTVEKAIHNDTKILGSLFAPIGVTYNKSNSISFKHSQKAKKYVEGVSLNVHILHKPTQKTIYVLGGEPLQTTNSNRPPENLAKSDLVFFSVPTLKSLKEENKYIDFMSAIAETPKTIVPVHWDAFYKKLDKTRCHDKKTLYRCLQPIFPLKKTMMNLEKEFENHNEVNVEWLTGFGEIRVYY